MLAVSRSILRALRDPGDPLVEALDEETGIGFERSNSPLAEASPLLAGLPFRAGDNEAMPWTGRDALLLGKLAQALAEGIGEIALETSDLEALASQQHRPLPDAFYVVATVAAESDRAIARVRSAYSCSMWTGRLAPLCSAASATPTRPCTSSSAPSSRRRAVRPERLFARDRPSS